MRVSCPTCNGEYTLDVLLNHQLARSAVARLVKLSLPFGAASLQYLALFKPASRALSFDRIATLVEELRVDIERGAITRKGRDWPVDATVWKAAIDTVLSMRDEHSLRLPLVSHALLHEIIVGLVDRAQARTEAEREAERRAVRAVGARDVPPRNLADLAADIAAPAAAVPTQPGPLTQNVPRAPAGPSRSVLETRARIEAAQRARQQADQSTTTEGNQP